MSRQNPSDHLEDIAQIGGLELAPALWPNLFYWNKVNRGGHFAAWEQLALFTDEVRKAFRSIRG